MIATRSALRTGLISGALWGVLFTGFTAGPALRTYLGRQGLEFAPRQLSLQQLARRALAGFGGGLLFGLGMALTASRAARTLSPAPGERPEWLEPGESILRHGPANHLRRPWWAVGGWLFLTGTRLHFRPHGVLQRYQPLSWPREDVAWVEEVNLLGMAPTGLRVHLSDESAATFSVAHAERSAWAAELTPSGGGASDRP